MVPTAEVERNLAPALRQARANMEDAKLMLDAGRVYGAVLALEHAETALRTARLRLLVDESPLLERAMDGDR